MPLLQTDVNKNAIILLCIVDVEECALNFGLYRLRKFGLLRLPRLRL